MRGYYGFTSHQIAAAMNHLLALPHVTVEEREAVTQALSHTDAGLDFADALHLTCYRECESVASFDDRKFARRVKRLGLKPRVIVP